VRDAGLEIPDHARDRRWLIARGRPGRAEFEAFAHEVLIILPAAGRFRCRDESFSYKAARETPLPDAIVAGQAGRVETTRSATMQRGIRSRQGGLSLQELLLAVTVMGCGLGLGLPSIGDSLARTRVQTATSALTNALAATRLAAIVERQRAVLCPSVDARSCAETVSWNSGWIAFVDSDRDGAPGPAERMLTVEGGQHTNLSLYTTTGRRRMVFQPDGRSGSSNLTFSVCHKGRARGRALVINHSGRVRSVDDWPCRPPR
jgi:type IV fimbrial biogenesis protein FimT